MSEKHITNKTDKPTFRGKQNGYSSVHLRAKRDRKRKEAVARQETHNSLSLEQKIAKAMKRRGKSSAELLRLRTKLMATPKKDVPAKESVLPSPDKSPSPAKTAKVSKRKVAPKKK